MQLLSWPISRILPESQKPLFLITNLFICPKAALVLAIPPYQVSLPRMPYQTPQPTLACFFQLYIHESHAGLHWILTSLQIHEPSMLLYSQADHLFSQLCSILLYEYSTAHIFILGSTFGPFPLEDCGKNVAMTILALVSWSTCAPTYLEFVSRCSWEVI
jgi:hypothetical protein